MADTRERDASGKLVTNQIGSQYWMNAGFTGIEPSLEVKAAFSTAEYASGWIGNYAQILSKQGTPVSGAVTQAASYPAASSPVLAAVWEKYYAVSPQAAYNEQSGKAAAAIVANQAQTGVVTPANAAIEKGTLNAATGLNDGKNPVNSVISTLGSYTAYIIIGVVVIVLAAVVMAKTHIGGSAA